MKLIDTRQELLDAKQEFRNFFILLSQNVWFNKISDSRQLEIINGTASKTEATNWDYDLKKLEFKNISLERHTRPLFINGMVRDGYDTSKLILSIQCNSKIICDPKTVEDPIVSLALKFIIQFEYFCPEKNDIKRLQSSWHLDKHDPSRSTTTSHPLYHYEYGGSEITKNADFNFGDFFLIDAPRIMHPPMDIVLAIDFILKHYYKESDHKQLTENKLYKRYLQNARIRVWRPYSILLASNFYDFSDYFPAISEKNAMNIIHCENPPPATS